MRPLLAVFAVLALAGPAAADTITVNMHDASGGAALAGTAAAVGGAGSGSATAGGSGQAVISGLSAGDYTVTAQLPGYNVARQTGVASGTVVSLTLTRSANKFTALPVFGGANGGLYADGQPGVFYAQSTQIPQLYRTTDWGGTWAPVTSAQDDSVEGLVGSANIGHDISATTSGYPGEIATIVSGNAFYSRDFGLTWKKIENTPSPADQSQPFAKLSWGHAGGTSVLVDTINDDQYIADMTASGPAFVKMATDYSRVADNQAFAVANGIDQPYIAVADNTGAVTVYPLTASLTPGSPVATATGFPGTGGSNGPPLVVAFGGAAPLAGPPSGIIVASAVQIGMSVKATGDATYPAAATVSNTQCASIASGGAGIQGRVTPDTGTSAGAGMGNINGCWIVQTGGGAPVASGTSWINFAIDAGWGQTIGGHVDHISFQGGTRGPAKSSALDGSSVPTFDHNVEASAGTDPASGGISVNGITAPTVEGQVFGPDAPNDQATTLHGGFGAVGYASTDGGTTVKIASGTGGWAVDWFTGASGSWLVFGAPAGNPAHTLTAFHNWTTATPEATTPNLAGAQTSDNSLLLSGSGLTGQEVFATALAGATGTDLVFVGLSDSNGIDGNADGVVRRLQLNDGNPPSATNVVKIGDGQITKAIHAMDYCPASGSDPSIGDVLMVATGTTTGGGGLWRVTGATGDAPTATQVASIPSATLVYKVRAHCASGTVWAGTNGQQSLFKSTDGGQTFTNVSTGRGGEAQAIGINPSDANEVLVGLNRDGTIMRTTDGGATWTVVNDPSFDHNFSGDGIADLLIPPATTATRALRLGARFSPRGFAGLTSKDVLVAGAGVYSARLRTTATSGGTTTTPGGGTGGTTQLPGVRPAISGLSLKPKRVRAGRTFTIHLTLSAAGKVHVWIDRAKPGWRKGSRCVAARPKRRPRHCTRYVQVRKLVTKTIKAGPAYVPVGTKGLKPGLYRARVQLVDATGLKSAVAKLSFRVLKRK